MSNERIIDFPSGGFDNFLCHMAADSASSKWTWSYIEICARFGVFYSAPDHTLLARPVNSAIAEGDLRAFNDLDPTHALASTDLTGKHDTWHILYASGDPSFFFDLCPYPLEKVSWHRAKGNDRLRTHSFQQLKKRFHDKSSP